MQNDKTFFSTLNELKLNYDLEKLFTAWIYILMIAKRKHKSPYLKQKITKKVVNSSTSFIMYRWGGRVGLLRCHSNCCFSFHVYFFSWFNRLKYKITAAIKHVFKSLLSSTACQLGFMYYALTDQTCNIGKMLIKNLSAEKACLLKKLRWGFSQKCQEMFYHF